jgi:hypothetical protein
MPRFAALLCLISLSAPCLAATDQQLIGTWFTKRDFMTLKLELRADHTLYWSSLTRDDPNRRPVTAKWRADQNNLFVRWELRND